MNAPIACRIGAAAAALLVCVACASLQVSSYQVRGFDMRQYRTYGWGVQEMEPTGDPRLDNNRFFDERVRRAVDAQLAQRQFERRTGDGRVDLIVHYHASATQKIEVSSLDRRYSPGMHAEDSALVVDAGTIFVDLIDARTNTLVWRGWAEGSLDGLVDDQGALERRIDEAVARIMQRLPRGL